MLCVLIRIVHSTYNHCVQNWKDFPKLSLFASQAGAMINPQWLELPMSRTNCHGPKDVRAIEVRLYLGFYGPFKNISLIEPIVHQRWAKPENPEKNHFTIHKQNLTFPTCDSAVWTFKLACLALCCYQKLFKQQHNLYVGRCIFGHMRSSKMQNGCNICAVWSNFVHLKKPWILGRRKSAQYAPSDQSSKGDHVKKVYSITSMAGTRMARLPWMIQTLFSVPTKFFQ